MQISNVENTKNPSNYSIRVRDKLVDLSTPIVMGIVNVTPDSFYAKSRSESIKGVLKIVEKMLHEGVNIVDIGGYSSRPNAQNIDISEEIDRVSPIIKAVRKEFGELNISLDTFRSEVARIGIENGADIINDISGFEIDPQIIDVVAHYKVPYVLMHMIGTPQNMTENTNYKNLFNDLVLYFSTKIDFLKKKGINDIILDPGFGFSKTIEQNYEILNFLEHLQLFNKPLLVGLSRKSMIYKKLGIRPEDSLPETIRLNKIALDKGASILRVHDVHEAFELIKNI
ncbi:dihydropteroate synthase [Crocinitomicaceae bacterium]|nr:dihydropteroate synthase [Crocinitomicaceae bacterium]